jgi:hypothetical protein
VGEPMAKQKKINGIDGKAYMSLLETWMICIKVLKFQNYEYLKKEIGDVCLKESFFCQD